MMTDVGYRCSGQLKFWTFADEKALRLLREKLHSSPPSSSPSSSSRESENNIIASSLSLSLFYHIHVYDSVYYLFIAVESPNDRVKDECGSNVASMSLDEELALLAYYAERIQHICFEILIVPEKIQVQRTRIISTILW